MLKFGGTSVGSPARMKALLDIINPDERQIVVLSAISGTTNMLTEIAANYQAGDTKKAKQLTTSLKSQYESYVSELLESEEGQSNGQDLINFHFDLITSLSGTIFTPLEEKVILAQGEMLSTTLFHYYLTERGIRSKWLPALEFVTTDEDHEPDIDAIRTQLTDLLLSANDHSLFITQGYICKNAHGEVDNLRRGGSDYTASLIGAAMDADEIQIWTDIDGIHNNDPRIVKGTKPLAHLSFDEAAELAYFGAKILHPQCIFPARTFNVPVRILDTLEPHLPGTLISNAVDAPPEHGHSPKVKAIAAKEGISAIRIHSSRMLLAYGFLRKIFEVFERFKTPIDMITTSEVAVSLTIDNTEHLQEILEELAGYGHVEADLDQTIVCVVGHFGRDTHGYASRILDAVKHLPVRMISYGGSNYNISLLIRTEDKIEALRSLHDRIF